MWKLQRRRKIRRKKRRRIIEETQFFLEFVIWDKFQKKMNGDIVEEIAELSNEEKRNTEFYRKDFRFIKKHYNLDDSDDSFRLFLSLRKVH